VYAVQALSIDISERKWAEEALRQSEAAYRSRMEREVAQRTLDLEKSNDLLGQAEAVGGMGSWEYEPDAGTFRWSEGMYRLLGLEPGQPVTPETYLAYVVAEDQPKAAQFVQAVRRAEAPAEGTIRLRHDGALRTFKVKAVVMPAAGEQPKRVLGAALDITALREAEAHLQESQALLGSIIDTSPVAIALLKAVRGPDGRITDFVFALVNPEAGRQARRTGLAGQRYREQFPGPEAAWLFKQLVRVVENEAPFRQQFSYPSSGEARRWYFCSAVRFEDGLVVLNQDLTDYKRVEAENQALRLQQQQALLLAILEAQEEERRRISESLHNGVGQILYATKLNLACVDLDAPRERQAQVRQAFGKTEDLLTEAIQETRRVSHELVPLLLKEYGLGRAIEEFCERFAGTGIGWHCHCFAERLPAPLEMAIYRICQELVNNIAKHSGASRATLEVSKSSSWVNIEAQDNGIGIVLDGKDRPLPKGIGLRTIQDRVKLLNGTMAIDAPAGKGTLVSIQLPLKGP
jgi:signal transduction histidine kinase